MMIVCAYGAHDCSGYPGQSTQSDGHVGGQHDVSENALKMAAIDLAKSGSYEGGGGGGVK